MKIKSRILSMFINSYLVALVFAVPVWVAFLFTDPILSGAGDLNIAEFVMSSGKIKDGAFFISPLLSKFLRFFSNKISLNWWSIFSAVILCTGLYVCLWFMSRRMKGYNLLEKFLLLALFDVMYWELILREDINFTRTSTVAAVMGILFMLDYCLDFKEEVSRKRRLITQVLFWDNVFFNALVIG